MPDYMFLLESRLSPEQRAAMMRVQELSAALGCNVYLTGGTVRALVTGASLRDLAFSVEGNPSRIAHELETGGARIISEDENFVMLKCSSPATVKGAFPPPATTITFARERALRFAGPPSWKICAAAIFLSTPSPFP